MLRASKVFRNGLNTAYCGQWALDDLACFIHTLSRSLFLSHSLILHSILFKNIKWNAPDQNTLYIEANELTAHNRIQHKTEFGVHRWPFMRFLWASKFDVLYSCYVSANSHIYKCEALHQQSSRNHSIRIGNLFWIFLHMLFYLNYNWSHHSAFVAF